ncbi:natural cytotoxicity triggering receptor 3 ligand 1 [Glossophaga mutica]
MAVDVEAAAGTLYRFVKRLLVLVFGLSGITAGSLKVEMAKGTQTVLRNHNATLSCKVLDSSHLNINNMAVIWFWNNTQNGTDVIVFKFHANRREVSRSGANVCLQGLAKGDASLQLSKVQLREAGQYRCKVVNTPDGGQGMVFLQVVAAPAISLFMEKAKGKDNDDQRFLCEATGFYPKSINITWCKWSQKNSQCLNISENFTTNVTIENEDHTFNVTSSLRPEHNATYQCMVEHMSLSIPWRRNITLLKNGSETKSNSWNPLWMITLCLVIREYYCIYCSNFLLEEASALQELLL